MSNVVAFAPRRREAEQQQESPCLEFVELRLRMEDCAIEMTLHDKGGDACVLTYVINAASPDSFDLNLLRDAWSRWRDCSGFAS
jgi:hypothetical protein